MKSFWKKTVFMRHFTGRSFPDGNILRTPARRERIALRAGVMFFQEKILRAGKPLGKKE